MDSVFSSGQNEQGISSIGGKAPEIVVDNEDELDDSHQHLLFGAASAPTSGSTGESGVISTAAKVGGTVQRARDNSADLNLVAISGITNAPEQTAKTGMPAINIDSNPLPAIARTGIATTVALQSPSAENVIPSGRRSGATDKIAIQLTEDSTPVPLIPTGLRLSEMDPVTRHNVAKASADLLFTQLATVAPGSGVARPAPVVSAALTRRKSGESAVGAETSDNATVSPTFSNTHRPLTDARPVTDTRTIVDGRLTDNRQNQVITPVARGTVDKVPAGGVTALPEALGTTYSAKSRTIAEPPVNPDSPANGAKPRSTVDTANTPDIPAGQRPSSKTAGESFTTGALNASVGGSPRGVETQDSNPIPARIQGKSVSDNAFVLGGTGVQTASDLPGILPPFRKSQTGGDHANYSELPNPPNTKGYPVQADRPIVVAKTFDPYAGTPTPQVVTEFIAPRSPRGHNDQPADANGHTGARSGESPRGLAILPPVPGDRGATSDKSSPVLKPAGTNADTPVASPAGRDTRQTLLTMLNVTSEQLATHVARNVVVDRIATNPDLPLTGGQTRREMQTHTQIQTNAPVIKDGQVFVPAAKPGSDAISSTTPLATGIRPDGPGGRTADGPKGTLIDVGTQLGTGINRLVSGANDLVNTTAKNPETGMPRADRARVDQPSVNGPGSVIRDASVPVVNGVPVNARNGETLPNARVNINDGTGSADKGARPLESGLGTERGAVKVVDTAAVAALNLPGNLVKNGDPVIAGDKATVKTAAGRVAIDAGRPAETTARAGESTARPGESVARAGETTARPGETTARPGETTARPGETTARPGETTARPGETTARAGETTARPGESVARVGETTGRAGENARTADGALKAGGESVISKNDAVVKSTESTVKAADGIVKSSETAMKVADNNVKAGEGGKVADVAARSVNQQVKASGDVSAVSLKPVEVAAKAGSEAAPVQKVQDTAARVGNDAVIKTNDAAVRDQNIIVRSQDVIANSQMVAADKGARLSDAIVRVADQAVKAPEVNQPVKLDGIARVTEQAAQNNQISNQPVKFDAAMQGNQIQANNQQPYKNDAARNDANAATRAGEQNQIVAHNQLGMQNQIAQNQNAAVSVRANEQIVTPAVKAVADCPIPAQKAPLNNIDNVKVDQVVVDILNHVRNAGKDQQAGAKILSSLDQSNIAANQQLDPKGLLDAAAVRRILDGQGIAINPATLNTIMEGIRPTGEHAVDYALPSIGSLNLSQIISLGERLQEAVAGAGSETSEPQPKPQLQQHRTKYLVKEGDTLESIAQEKLGDARLVQLLITINRALVNYRLEGERKVAYVVPNQYLWLPTDHELDVHKKNFFGKQGKDGSVSLGISSKQNTPLIAPVSFDRTIEVSAEVSASMEDFRPGSGSSQPLSGNRISAGYEVKKYVPSLGSASGSRSGSVSGSSSGTTNDSTGASKDNKMAGNLDKVRRAGNRKSVNLDEFEYASTQVSHRQCYQVREGETLMSIAASLESMGHISMWKLLAKINGFQIEEGGLGKSIENLFQGQFIVLPTTEELNEFKLMDKLSSCASSPSIGEGAAKNAFFCVQEQKKIEIPPPPALVALVQGIGGLTTVHKLSSYTRLVLNDLPQLENCFSITVETRWNGQWKPMASYECRHGQTTRHLYNKQGEIRSMELDLPPYVVKEMAREDFIRNWNAYVNSFMGEAVERFV
jgi:hypothetical protein